MNSNLELTEYMNGAVTRLVTKVMKTTPTNPRETAFLLKMRSVIRKANKKRAESEAKGIHIPTFLISSITNRCNLYCKGCYARENNICNESGQKPSLSASRWAEIFKEAAELGITFNLLAGGEPLMRKEIILKAAKIRNMIFLIFTNGLLIDEEYRKLLSTNRHLIPVISLEGEREATEERRGEGTYDRLIAAMKELQTIQVFYGVSITVTNRNIKQVTHSDYVRLLSAHGCRLIFFIEYVPVARNTQQLVLSDVDRQYLEERQDELRNEFEELIILSFPGDEKYLGGCLAAGRGFFHINPYGGAEPCPFSPYSDRNLSECSLSQVLESPLFHKLTSAGLVGGEHQGGCALFEHDAEIKAMVGEKIC